MPIHKFTHFAIRTCQSNIATTHACWNRFNPGLQQSAYSQQNHVGFSLPTPHLLSYTPAQPSYNSPLLKPGPHKRSALPVVANYVGKIFPHFMQIISCFTPSLKVHSASWYCLWQYTCPQISNVASPALPLRSILTFHPIYCVQCYV